MDWQLEVDDHWRQMDGKSIVVFPDYAQKHRQDPVLLTWQYHNLQQNINHIIKRMQLVVLLSRLSAPR